MQEDDVRLRGLEFLRHDARQEFGVLAAVALMPKRSVRPLALLRADELVADAGGAQLLVERQPVGHERLAALGDRITDRQDAQRLGGGGKQEG